VVVAGLATFQSGCGHGASVAVPPSDVVNLDKIQAAYLAALTRNGKAPADAKDAWPFLKEQGDPEKLLTSPVDGEPYVIFWGIDWRKTPIASMPPPIIAHERVGKDGKRYVLTVMGVQSMTDEQFGKATFIGKTKS
jgi:hypothetical protein